jgi:hypothetical protein
MAKTRKRERSQEKPQWMVCMRIERDISMVVEADDEDEARAKAEEFDSVGDEQVLDTLNWEITSLR